MQKHFYNGEKLTVLYEDGIENTGGVFIGNLNPFRWKGHYYDRETCLYYINGSYYDPAVGRFVNVARIENILNGGENLYAWAANP